jgi:cytochrome c oxidase subunit II
VPSIYRNFCSATRWKLLKKMVSLLWNHACNWALEFHGAMHLSVFNPASPEAARLLWLWHACMWVCGFIFAVVTLALAYILIRYRRRTSEEPGQITGSTKLEIIWTLVPFGLVSLLFVLAVVAARAVDRPFQRDADIVVVGHQWWWEVRYPAANAITANEVHIPAGQDVLVGVESADVIHDFAVPRLTRRIDAIPGRRNLVWLRADAPGDYLGACAEYCGAQHAWMRFRVIAQDEASYRNWLAVQASPAVESADTDAQQGRMRFKQLTCANCHNITGVNQQEQYAPDLTHLASRKMLAAGRLENTPQNLRDWLRQPEVIKPACLMPNLNLSADDLNSLTAYLGTLK